MSGQTNVFFGEYIRELRTLRKLPLRKVASELDIDPSTLGKIERSTRRPPKEIIDKLASIFNVDLARLKSIYLSDKISFEVLSEGLDKEVLEEAEQKINILKSRNAYEKNS
ncbi:MAG: helix-turn-helix transcriptional regulator [Bacteroidota bacterium]|nr:helix-turn-helix transcriptional regulator [Bacteroidota bacterium]